MDIEIRTIAPEEYAAWLGSTERAFGIHADPEELDLWRGVTEYDRDLAAVEGGDIVGSAAAFSLTLTVPGGRLPMAGVAAVAVLPTHRRRGILSALMRRQLDDLRDGREPVAGLWAAESAIYGRFGYGSAAPVLDVEIERSWTAFARPVEARGRIRLLSRDEALKVLPEIHDRIGASWPGFWARDERWWRCLTADLERWRDGASATFYAVHETAGRPDGWVQYRIKKNWDHTGPNNELRISELQAENPDAYIELWHYVFGVDLIRRITARPRPADEPMVHLLAEPRRLVSRVTDSLWLRPVDIPRMLAARRYSAQGRVVFEVTDAFCPWNDGRYELEAGPEGAECRRSHAGADLALPARALGAAFLGGVRFGSMARAGLVRELTLGGLARADAMFAWDPAPWCPTVF